ncbi:ATP-binding protein [Kordia sp.]|uniref:ATP-binding protein n=1 Tax=Kordia sp. TaxID=1965332 RepID=UPI003B5984CD
MIEKKTIPDADLSSAGDDFHILWTIKKSLELLNFDPKGLKAIRIEDLERSLSLKTDPYGEKLLGIDLVEYYGGENFIDADSLVISQLKYSTRRASENWTFSSLYKGKKSGSYRGSIIHRFASIYKTLNEEFGRKLVLEKVKIKLVSNRDINSSQLQAIHNVQKALLPLDKKRSFNSILKNLKSYKSAFQKLLKASELKVTEFSDFISLLDFEDCGANSRDQLERALIVSISNTSISSRDQFNNLSRLVWKKMMPESKNNVKLTLYDIIASLGFTNGSLENLFPVSQHFENLSKRVERQQLQEILIQIEESNGLPICIHGGAGVGKSTLTQQLRDSIPKFCECITFDCYGNGSYLDPSDRRHLHKNALLQITNEIAKKIGIDFLINRNESEDIYLREFKRRINDAIKILKGRNEKAYLVIIIDAADNNITAAERRKENSFVHDLLEEQFSEDCKLIFTTRTYRKGSLKLPSKYIDIEISPFTLNETEKHLKYFFPNSTTKNIEDFHLLTKGIPRVQSYAIDLKKEGIDIDKVINYLKPNGKIVEDLIEEKINEASKRIGNNGNELITKFFSNLITLPRPVPLEFLSKILFVKDEFLQDLSADIWHGLILDDNKFSFRDEDFENYIREKYKPTNSDLKNIAELFKEQAVNNEYASINLADTLFQAGLKEDLKEVVLENKYRLYPTDPIRNKEVYIDRAKLAMRVADSQTDNLTFFKLLFIAAAESKTDKALTKLLVDNPDLVIMFGDETSLNKLTSNSEEKSWGGSFHLKLAGMYSRNSFTVETARKHLKIAHNWLSWRHNSVNEDELGNYPISSLDIAFETEAILRLTNDPIKAFESLSRWSPKSVRISSGNYLLDNILLFSKKEDIKNWLKELKVPFATQVFIINKLFKFGINIDGFETELLVSFLLKVLNKKVKFKRIFYSSIIDFCEIISFENKVDKDKIIEILNKVEYEKLDRVPSFSNKYFTDKDSEIELDINLRINVLLASLNGQTVQLENLYPDKFKDIEQIKDYDERRSVEDDKKDFSRFFRHALTIFQIKADKITGRLNHKECIEKFSLICTNIEKDWEFRHYNYRSQDYLNYLASRILDFLLLIGLENQHVDLILNSFKDDESNRISLRLKILNKISHFIKYHATCLKLLDEIDKYIEEGLLSATETTELYLECTLYGSKIDKETGKHYFDKAIEAVSDIDYEAFEKIKCIYELSEQGIPKYNPELAYQYARFVEYADIKLGDYDKKHFPYKDGLKGIFNLDPSSAFTILCRWHHRNIIDIDRYVSPLLNIALKNKTINHRVAGSLLTLNGYYYYYYYELVELYDNIIKSYNDEGDIDNKSYFVKTTYRDLRLGQQSSLLEALYLKVKDNKFLEEDTLVDFDKYIEFRKVAKKGKETKYKSIFSKESYPHNIDIESIDILSAEDIENSIKTIIVETNKKHYHRQPINSFLSEIKNKCYPKDYVNQLEALVNVSPEVLNFYSFESALKDRIKEWKIHPGVKKWMQNNFRYVLLTWFNQFNDDNYLSVWKIKEFADLFCMANENMVRILMNILPEKIELLTDESIYRVFNLINNCLTKEENEDLISWVLKNWNSVIDDNIADGKWNKELLPPESLNKLISEVLRFVLGYPDKRSRWLAIHSIRKLINVGELEIIKNLLDSQNEKDCHPFQNKDYMFYWISAKLYLWIALERTSKENPKALIPFKSEFYKELLNIDLPHVLIRSFIKKTCQNLIAYDNQVYTNKESKIIKSILISPFEKISRDELEKRNKKISFNTNWKFNFDALDTLPYLYKGLSRTFFLSENSVADIADKYIYRKWGYKGNPNKEDYVRDNLRNERNYYELTSNRKGNIPTVETLKTYFEYHAMFCAANDLLQKYPLVKPEYDGDWGTWDYWLASKSNTWEDYWLSDSRDALPLEKKYWVNEFDKFDEKWRDNIEEEKYDLEVGFGHYFNKNYLIVFRGGSRYFGENYESVSIRSALVSDKGSEALLRAFQTAKDHYDYAIPFESDEHRFEIKDFGFEYLGWLNNPTYEHEGLDLDDPFYRDVGKDYIVFGKCVLDLFDIDYDNFFKKAFFNSELISEYKHWNETTEYKYRDDVQSDGVELRVNISFILEFLKRINKCMIIECRIERQLEKRVYRMDRKELEIPNNIKIYLIKQDGTVRTLRGRDYKIR